MSEKINFIPATDLPVAEGDEVSVLCLENGEMKRKPGVRLGDGKTDVVIEMTDGEAAIKSGSYNELVDKLRNGEMVGIDVVGTHNGRYLSSRVIAATMSEDDAVINGKFYGTTNSIWNMYIGPDYVNLD